MTDCFNGEYKHEKVMLTLEENMKAQRGSRGIVNKCYIKNNIW